MVVFWIAALFHCLPLLSLPVDYGGHCHKPEYFMLLPCWFFYAFTLNIKENISPLRFLSAFFSVKIVSPAKYDTLDLYLRPTELIHSNKAPAQLTHM